MNRKILGLLVGGVFVVVAFLLVTRQPDTSKPASPKSTPVATASAAPTATPAIQQVVDIANSFTSVYLTYDWQHPADVVTAIKPYTSDRLYGTLINDGTTPDGRNAPWTSVRPDLHETDQVIIDRVTSQEPSEGQASVQQAVREISNTDLGHSETTKEIDLSLQKQNGSWVVDWVSERKSQQ